MVTFWKSALDWLLKNYPLIGLVLIVAALVWVIARAFFNAKHQLKEISETVKDLPCASHTESIREHSSMKPTLDSINEQVTEISKWIMHLDGNMIDVLSQKCSPRIMTALGRNLFEKSGARKTIDDNIDFLIHEIASRNPTTPYDVENVALDVLLGNLAHPMFNEVKNYLYYQPEEVELEGDNGEHRKVRISLGAIIKLMSLEVRDRYLTAHPEVLTPPETPTEPIESDASRLAAQQSDNG